MKARTLGQEGQGLVEYGMILVLVVIVLVYSLMSLGITVHNTLYNPIVEQFDEGPLRGVMPERTGGGHGNDVVVTIAVSTSTWVTVTDSQSGQSASLACTDTCQITFIGVGHERGTVNVTAGTDTGMGVYPPQKI